MRRSFVFSTLLAVAAATAVEASPIVYTSAATFGTDAGLAGIALTTENFNTFPTTSSDVTVNGVTVSDGVPASSNAAVGPAIFGTGQSVTSSTNPPTLVRFSFASAINAFGISVFDLGTVGATTLSYTLSNGATGNIFINYSGGGALFAGIIDSTPFTYIQFGNTVGGDFVEMDNASFGATAVPEPATLLLLGGGLAAVAARRRRAAGRQ